MQMTLREKEHLCELMAGLLSPPERGVIDEIRKGDVFSFLAKAMKSWGGDPALLIGLQTSGSPEALYVELQREYDRLFSEVEEISVPLIESPYKPWTQDGECRLSFAREKGLLRGDSALHMAAIFRDSGVEVPQRFDACPDHLVMELKFLSALYAEATDHEVRQFIQDHLDWIPQLKKEMIRFQPHPFYVSAVELLDLFLNHERDRLERIDHGEKSFH
jgi:TorA maturation chaperone TorD